VSGLGDRQNGFPKLPIVVIDSPPPPQPPRTQLDKYGGLLYLGIAGLAVMALLIAWFAYSLWQLRDVWTEVYALHDSKRSSAQRIESALKLSRDPRVTDRQLMEICLHRDLPDQARYLLAEAVSTEAVARPSRLRSRRGPEPRLARLAAPGPVAAPGLRRDPRIQRPRSGT
jgi:hypothetical protein